MLRKIIYAIIVFCVLGFGLFTISKFEEQKLIKKCQNQSDTKGGITACIEYHQSLES